MTRPRPRTRIPLRSLSHLARAAVLLAIAACSSPSAQGPGRPLPAYAGRSMELFDDTIEPGAVGISLEAKSDPRADRTLRERTQVGDAVVRVRATTVTAKQEDTGTRYFLGLHTLDRVAGQFPPAETFEVTIGPLSSSGGILKHMEEAIVGKTFIAFTRAFVRPDGDQELHFHLAPDSADELAAVKEAAALRGL